MTSLRTGRLVLRAFVPEDAPDLVELDSDPAVMEFLGPDRGTSLESARAWIAWVNATFAGERGFWAAEEDGRFVGWFHLRPARDTSETELGYRLRRDAWGRGLATEGSQALIELAGERVIARTMILNARSRRVMEKLGMAVVRTFPYSGKVRTTRSSTPPPPERSESLPHSGVCLDPDLPNPPSIGYGLEMPSSGEGRLAARAWALKRWGSASLGDALRTRSRRCGRAPDGASG